MEIAEYARLVARRARLVVAIVVVAAVVAVLVFLLRPRTYAASTSVVVPVPPGSSLIASVSQSVSDFEAALSTDSVSGRVASATGVSASDVSGGLSSERLGPSGVVQVRFEYTDPDLAERVAFDASREALILLLRARLAPYEEQLSLAEAQADAAWESYLSFLDDNSLVVPNIVFAQEENEMQDLRNRIGAALTAGDDALAQELQARLDAKAERLVPQSAEYDRISSEQQRSSEALAGAQIAYNAAAGALESVERADPGTGGGGISATDAVRVSRRSVFLRTVVPTVVIATALAIVLVVLLEVLPVGVPARGALRRKARELRQRREAARPGGQEPATARVATIPRPSSGRPASSAPVRPLPPPPTAEMPAAERTESRARLVSSSKSPAAARRRRGVPSPTTAGSPAVGEQGPSPDVRTSPRTEDSRGPRPSEAARPSTPTRGERAAKERAAKEQAAKEQAAKEQAAKEQAAKEQAAKEQAAKEQAAKEQAAKEQAAGGQATQDQDEETRERRARKAQRERRAKKARGQKARAKQAQRDAESTEAQEVDHPPDAAKVSASTGGSDPTSEAASSSESRNQDEPSSPDGDRPAQSVSVRP